MTKDRDQLTPAEPDDRSRIHPHRSAAKEAEGPLDGSTGRGPGSRPDPAAAEEVDGGEKEKYRP